MLKNILELNGVTKLNKEQQNNVSGGVTRKEYCDTLRTMIVDAINGNGGTNNLELSSHFYNVNCAQHGQGPIY
ncbi:hypothetical protein [Kordia sp.]|uniref:hypothetical protein n=1 Tax=Kordia sp. TaxID=1965332 RepID=UPI003B5B9C20